MELFFKIKLIFIAVYFILTISLERIYNNKLFNKSLDIIPDFQESSEPYDIFWNFMTFFGTKLGVGIIYVIFFLFIPLNQVFALTFLLLFTGYLDNTLQILYLQERPIWIKEEINTGNKHACIYGNPSGHSLTSSSLYLSLWFILSQNIDNKVLSRGITLILKYAILILSILIISVVMISRLYFGVHSLNQIIFGGTIGIGIFLLFLPILKIYHNSGNEFFSKQYLNKHNQIIFTIICIIFYYALYFGRKDLSWVKEKPNWQKMCNDQKWSKILIKGSFFGGMSAFIILGMILGLLFSKNQIDKEFYAKEEIIINWDQGSFLPRLFRMLILLLGFTPIGIIFLLNYIFDITYYFYYIFTPILFCFGGFLTFGPCFFYGFKIILRKFGYEEIYNFNKSRTNSNRLVDYSNEIFN